MCPPGLFDDSDGDNPSSNTSRAAASPPAGQRLPEDEEEDEEGDDVEQQEDQEDIDADDQEDDDTEGTSGRQSAAPQQQEDQAEAARAAAALLAAKNEFVNDLVATCNGLRILVSSGRGATIDDHVIRSIKVIQAALATRNFPSEWRVAEWVILDPPLQIVSAVFVPLWELATTLEHEEALERLMLVFQRVSCRLATIKSQPLCAVNRSLKALWKP